MGDSIEVPTQPVGLKLSNFRVIGLTNMVCLVCDETITVEIFSWDPKTKTFQSEDDVTLLAFYFAALSHDLECNGSR